VARTGELVGAGAQQVAQSAGGNDAALVHDGRVGSEQLDFGQQVAGDQNRGAFAGKGAETLAEGAHFAWVEAVGRLVEHQDLGCAHERLREREALTHAHRVALHLAVDGRAEAREREALFERRGWPGVTSCPPQQLEVAPTGEVRHEGGAVDEHARAREHRRPRWVG
jgi:hypothetical protein